MKYKMYPLGVNYYDRHVYAALSMVSVELCKKCPYFHNYQDTQPGVDFKQPGACCYCRDEARKYNMTGQALCC